MCTKCDINTTITKQCVGICGKVKSLFYFYAESGNKMDGHRGTCKECDAIRFRNRTDKIKAAPKKHIENQKCRQCKEIRHRDLFSCDIATKTGLMSLCKMCVKENLNNPETKEQTKIMAKKSRKKMRAIRKAEKEAFIAADKLVNPEKYIVQPKPQRIKKPIEIKTFVYLKQCTGKYGCGEIKHRSEFNVDNYSSVGLRARCKDCDKKIANIPENKEKARNIKIRYLANEENKRKTQNAANANAQRKRKTDPAFKLRGNVSRAINTLLKKNGSDKDGQSVLDHLSYTIEELREHLENQFKNPGNEWMNWDNYGRISRIRRTWHIDHIYPQSLLPYTSMEEENFQKAWALSNLQPLEAFANIRKSNKIITPTDSTPDDISFPQITESSLKSA